MQDVAEASAKAAIKKATAVWKRKHEENHAVEAVNSVINNLELDCEENSASDISEFSSWRIGQEDHFNFTWDDSKNKNKQSRCLIIPKLNPH